MKFKSILSIIAFAAAFISSAAVAGLFAVEQEYQSITPIVVLSETASRPTSCFARRRGANASAVAKINVLLEQDDVNGNARTVKIARVSADYEPPFADDASFNEYAAATARYADASGAIKDVGFPTEFQMAWREHMKAWRDYADFLEAMKSSEMRRAMDEDDFTELNNSYNSEITRSWFEVLRVAGDAGADAGKYYLKSVE